MNGNKPNRKWQRQVDHPGPKWWHRHHRRWTYGMHAWSNRSASAVVEGFVWPNKTMCNEICEQFCTCCGGVPRERERGGSICLVIQRWYLYFYGPYCFCLVSFWSQYFSLKCQHKKNTFVWYCCSPSAVGKWLLGVPWKWKNGHHIDVLVKVWLLSTFLRNSLSKHPDFSEILPPLEPTIEKLHPSGRRKIPMETSFFQGFVWKFGNGVEEETQ